MGKPVPRTSALVVSAIRKLREVQGSTSREIMNFITTEYDVPAGSNIKRQLQAALKRGLEYGILKRHQGHYTLSTDGGSGVTGSGGAGRTVGTIQEDETVDLVDACPKKRRKYRKCKKTRRCARGCVPRRRKKSCGKKRRHSRRRRGCPKRCGAGGSGNIDGENLALNPLDESGGNRDVNAKRSHHSSRSTRSRSQSLSQSRSRSRSRNSSRIGNRETSTERREKQTE